MIFQYNKYYFIGIFSFFLSLSLIAQNNYELKYTVTDNLRFNKSEIVVQNIFKDSINLHKELNNLILKFQTIGFIEAQTDTVTYTNNTVNVRIKAGKQYEWGQINTKNNYWENTPNIHYKYQDFNSKSFNYIELQSLFNNIITSLENSGYPFATVKLDNIVIKHNKIYADLFIRKGELIKIDTILLDGYNRINLAYMERYLGIHIGEIYNEQKINEIGSQLNRLEICQAFKPSEVTFKKNKAIIRLYLREKKVNLFNGIIGFQPNSTNSNNLQITGQIHLKLKNAFQRGETIEVKWESLGNSSQKIKAHFRYPYLLNSPFGIDYKFILDKRDSSFLNINNQPSLLFALKGLNYLSIYANFFNSNTLVPAESVTPSLGIIDMHSNIYGFEVFINTLDYTFNPRKGYLFRANADVGYKYFDNRADVNPTVYDSIPSQEIRFSGKGEFSWFIPIFRQQTILISNKSAILQSKNTMKNELYRVGGFKILRGFDEQSLYATSYSIFSLEYRFLLDQNTNIGAFWDFGSLQNTLEYSNYNIYQGFGIRFSFASKAGIFNLAYALGKTNKENILFKNSKIHFGYSALF